MTSVCPCAARSLFLFREQGPWATCGHSNCVSVKFPTCTKFVFQCDLCRVLEEWAPYRRNEENGQFICKYPMESLLWSMTELEFKQEAVRLVWGRLSLLFGGEDLGDFGSDPAQLGESRGDCVSQSFPWNNRHFRHWHPLHVFSVVSVASATYKIINCFAAYLMNIIDTFDTG